MGCSCLAFIGGNMSEVKKKIISLEVRGEYILGSGVAIGAEGSFDSVYLRVKFDEHWLGLSIYATWEDALGHVGDQQIFLTALDLVDGEPDTYDIPVTQFVTKYPGTVRLALSGYVVGGEAGNEIESLINTVSGAFRVLKSGATRLDSGKVDATLEERVVSILNKMTAIADGLKGAPEAEEERRENETERLNSEDKRKANEANRENNESRRESQEAARGVKEEELDARLTALEKRLNGIDAYLYAIIDLQKKLIGGDA